jgi:L-arabinose isomerase
MHTSQESVFWLITGSQHLYGDETLRAVAGQAPQKGKQYNSRPPHAKSVFLFLVLPG